MTRKQNTSASTSAPLAANMLLTTISVRKQATRLNRLTCRIKLLMLWPFTLPTSTKSRKQKQLCQHKRSGSGLVDHMLLFAIHVRLSGTRLRPCDLQDQVVITMAIQLVDRLLRISPGIICHEGKALGEMCAGILRKINTLGPSKLAKEFL